MEETKEKLRTYLNAKKEHERWLRLLEETETRITSVSQDYSAVKVQTTPQTDRFADVVDRLECLKNQCLEKSLEEAEAMVQVTRMIGELEDADQKDVLTRRYIEDNKWEQIAYEMGCSWRKIHYLHSEALKSLHRFAH